MFVIIRFVHIVRQVICETNLHGNKWDRKISEKTYQIAKEKKSFQLDARPCAKITEYTENLDNMLVQFWFIPIFPTYVSDTCGTLRSQQVWKGEGGEEHPLTL